LVGAALWAAEKWFQQPAPSQVSDGGVAVVPLVVPEGKLGDWERSNIELFRSVAPSVAAITVEKFGNPLTGIQGGQGAGSGFVWDKVGHVITNYHVIAGADTVQVQLHAGEPIKAKVVGGSADYDIAVVKLIDVPANLQPIAVGNSKTLQVGQATYAIGNPFGLSRTLTTGIVSALERHLPTAQGREVRGVIQTDASINPGNSGGPLLDSSGRLIGVNTAILSESGMSGGIGFAIPVDLVIRAVPQIIATGRAARPGIGIAAADERLAAQIGVRGVIVAQVAPGSPAQRAGLVPLDPVKRTLGDVIVALNGKPVSTVADLASALDEAGVGNDAVLTVKRGNTQHEIKTRVIDLQDR
jgi:2-alkenal reductase